MGFQKNSPLMTIYNRLYAHLGPSHWWPGETPLEIMVGAILTQNTAWSNVKRAIGRLKEEGALNASRLKQMDEALLSEWIRPAGYYRIKARRLKNFLDFFFREFGGKVGRMKSQSLEVLRSQLLEVRGIGPETADSILLYALGMPTFVVDAYTHRIFFRHQLIEEDISYEDLRSFFMDHLPLDPGLYNEYHALLVRLGKDYCKKKNPRCEECPMKEMRL
jgi:endonuclease III related protein